MPRVSLAAFEPDRHLRLVAAWLPQPHVTRWWGDPEAALAEVCAHRVETAAIIEADGQPVGYLCWQTPSPGELAAAGLGDLPADLVDIDLMIGVADRLGRGIGPEALAQLCLRLRGQGASTAGLGTATANGQALRAFEKAGFRPYRDFQEGGVGMRYLIRSLAPPSH